MTRTLTVILLVILTAQGCAQFQHALQASPERFEAAWDDPVRRQHVIWQSAHLVSTSAVTLGCAAIVPFPFSLGVCPFVGLGYNYLSYEYVLEPWAKARVAEGKPSTFGPYFERGPQDGEQFIRP